MTKAEEEGDPQEMLKARLEEIKELKGPQRSLPCVNQSLSRLWEKSWARKMGLSMKNSSGNLTGVSQL